MSNFKKSRLISKPRRQELRHRATQAEKNLWPALRALRKTGFIFRQQHSIGWYIADFYCSKVKLVIEVDGGIHNQKSQKMNDEIRNQWMASQSIRILRFRNEEIDQDLRSVMLKIMQALGIYTS